MESKNIFDRISERAKEKGISINSLEDQAGVATGSIYKWNTVSPTIKNLKKVAEVLGCGIEELAEEEKENIKPQKKGTGRERSYLKQLRKEKGFSQYEVAAQLGVVPSYYCDIENGVKQKELKVNTIIKLAEILDTSAEMLISEEVALKGKIEEEQSDKTIPPHIVIKTNWARTEIFVDGKKLEKVRKISFIKDRLKMPVLTIDLLAADVTIDSYLIPELPEVFRGFYEPNFVSPEE